MLNKEFLTYSQFTKLLDDKKRSSDPVWCRYVYRPLSFPFGWLIYRCGIRANTVSLFTIFLSIFSCALMTAGGAKTFSLSVILMLFVATLDCIDGNVARARNEAGPAGEWMDALSGYTVYALLPLSLGVYINLQNPSEETPGIWIVVGASTAIANLFLRLIHQKFINSTANESSRSDLKSTGVLFSRLSSEMGLVGWMMPALALAAIMNGLKLYMAVYCVFYLASASAVSLALVKKLSSLPPRVKVGPARV